MFITLHFLQEIWSIFSHALVREKKPLRGIIEFRGFVSPSETSVLGHYRIPVYIDDWSNPMRHFLSLNYTQLQLFTMRGNLEHIGCGTPRWAGFMHFGVLDQKRTLQSKWPSSFFRLFLRKAQEWPKSLASGGLSCWLVLFTSMLHRLIVFHASTLSIFGKLALAPVHASDTSGTSIRKVTSDLSSERADALRHT